MGISGLVGTGAYSHRTLVARLKLSAAFALLCGNSCAPLTEDQIIQREIRQVEAEAEFRQRESACLRKGGVMIYDHFFTSRIKRKMDPIQMKTAYCDMSMRDIIRR